MPLPLGQQRNSMKERLQSRVQTVQNRKQTMQYLCIRKSIREVCSLTGVSKSTVERLSRAIRSKDDVFLSAMTIEVQSRGRLSATTDDEAKEINDCLILASPRGYLVDISSFKYVLGRVAQDGRKGCNSAEPADDSNCAYSARYPDLAYKKVQNKENT